LRTDFQGDIGGNRQVLQALARRYQSITVRQPILNAARPR